VEEVLGKHIDDRDFLAYLADWRTVMAGRIDHATSRLVAIPGVRGLILAGSNGIGQPWPLSDIDLIPVYADGDAGTAIGEVERLRVAILEEWSTQGWRTGLDIGRLHFRTGEIAAAFRHGDPDPVPLLQDDRWYHTIDKAYRGRPLHDLDGHAARLAAWFTSHRFLPEVVDMRRARSAADARTCLQAAAEHLAQGDSGGAWYTCIKAIQWQQISLMEGWGERDNSLGRFGTRFGHEAESQGANDVAIEFDRLVNLDQASVASRLSIAPAWVHERNDRSWRARQAVGEPVTLLENNCDVLRVCTIYGLRSSVGPLHAPWLAVPGDAEIHQRLNRLGEVIDRLQG
jgi:hypothetical protein